METGDRSPGNHTKSSAALTLGLQPSANTDMKRIKSSGYRMSLFTSVGLSAKEPVSSAPERWFPTIRIRGFHFDGLSVFLHRNIQNKLLADVSLAPEWWLLKSGQVALDGQE